MSSGEDVAPKGATSSGPSTREGATGDARAPASAHSDDLEGGLFDEAPAASSDESPVGDGGRGSDSASVADPGGNPAAERAGAHGAAAGAEPAAGESAAGEPAAEASPADESPAAPRAAGQVAGSRPPGQPEVLEHGLIDAQPDPAAAGSAQASGSVRGAAGRRPRATSGPAFIEVLRAGPMVSVQDTGRLGQRALGVARAGAMDVLSLVLANLLVGNPRDAAGLEITMPNLRVKFGRATRIALTGADVDARLDGEALLPWWSYPVAAGAELSLRPPGIGGAVGLHAYLAVAGGIDVEEVLGSRSTDLKAGFGGFNGRPLANGDRLPMSRAAAPPTTVGNGEAPPFGIRSPAFFWPRSLGTDAVAAVEVRFLPGPEWEDFSLLSRRLLSNETWVVSPRSNRIGYRLSGATLVRLKARDRDLLSHGVLPGVIQVPPDGQPIVLLADAQTTGGYPKIGVVISADIAVMAQVRPGARVSFVPCEPEVARRALRDVERYLAQMTDVIAERLARAGR